MRMLTALLGLVALALATIWWMAPQGTDTLENRTDLPWQITPLADGGARVLDLDLGRATLADAQLKFGEPERMALYLDKDGSRSLEVYFGTVRLGRLKAKIVVALNAGEAMLDELERGATTRKPAADGSFRLLLADNDKSRLASLPLASITYVPGYDGLEADFFRERLGEPDAWLRESAHAVNWFFPRLGLSLLIDADGKEVFQYMPPRAFRLPPNAQTAGPTSAARAEDQ
ncbi:MAG: hypothetical protein ABFS23_04350 [Pseudomonadota bacterium]